MRPAIGLSTRCRVVREEIPDTGECEPELGIRSRTDRGGDEIRRLKSGPRGVGHARKVLGLGSAAQKDTEAHPVGDRVRECLAGVEAMACVIVFGAMGVQQAKLAQKLAFPASIPHGGKARCERIPSSTEDRDHATAGGLDNASVG